MKRIIPKTLTLSVAMVMLLAISSVAQRVITGTVYKDGKPAAGVTVEAHKSSESFMTSFDGKYSINADPKTKYMKFTFIDDSRKLEIEGKPGDVFDFSFSGEIPTIEEEDPTKVILKSADELIKSGDKEFMNNYTMEDQFYKQKDFASSFVPWRVLYHKYPKSTLRIYQHGVKMFEDKYNKSANWTDKGRYVDTLMIIYDKRIKYFGDKGLVRGYQGLNFTELMLKNDNLSEDQQKAITKKGYGYLEESLKLQGDSTSAPVLLVYMQTTKKLFKMGELPKEKVVENYETSSAIVDKHLAKDPKNQDFIDSKTIINNIFETSGAADCEALIKLYEPKFTEVSKDLEALKKILRMLDKQDCTESELFAKASEKLYELEPSPEAAYNMGNMFVKRDNFSKAKEYFQQAIASEQDKERLSTYYFVFGAHIMSKEQKYQEAVGYFRKAVQNNPNNGNALLYMGEAYAAYSKYYGEKDIEHQSMFWLAVDYFTKAKKIDPELTARANERISFFSNYFPNKETVFFETLQEGQPYTIGSWINETTTVRASK